MINPSTHENYSGFKEVWKYIREAFSAEYCHWVCLVYFFVVVVLFGGAGLWESLCNVSMPNSVMACNTIALSVATSACVDLLFSNKNRPLQALGLSFLVAVILLHLFALFSKSVFWISGLLAILAWLFAHVVWWIINAHNPNLFDVDPDDSSGGSTSRVLAGMGEHKGLKVD